MTCGEEGKQPTMPDTTLVQAEQSTRRPWIFAGTCLLALVMLVSAYSNSFHSAFHFDDDHVIETNLYIRSLTNIRLFFTDARTFSSLPTNATYRPLVTVSLALDYWLGGGLAPWQFHLSQFVMLLILSMMVFFFFLRIDGHGRATLVESLRRAREHTLVRCAHRQHGNRQLHLRPL